MQTLNSENSATEVTETASRVRGTPQITTLPDGDEILNRPALALRLDVSERHIDHLVRAKRIPFLRLGKTVRFRWRQVIAATEVPPVSR